MYIPIFISESRPSGALESPLLGIPDPSFTSRTPLRRSKWEWASLILRTIFMVVFTLAFVSGSLMTVMVFDSAGDSWTWKGYSAAWGLDVAVGLLDSQFIYFTVQLLRKMLPCARPSNW